MKLLTLIFLLSSYLAMASEMVLSQLPGETINRPWYTLNYNEEHEVANWIEYTLESSQLRNCVSRAKKFLPDPLVSTGSAEVIDYKNSGFDRGHLIPAGDMKFDFNAMRDTFYLSNITPQPAIFNRGQWGKLEVLIRSWARKYGKLWIVTGPVLRPSLPQMGHNNRISIPDEYYKVILRKHKNQYKGIAFLMSTDVPFPELQSYGLEIDAVEDITKLDFFPFMTKEEERRVEGEYEPAEWDFTARFDYLPCDA